MARPQILPRSRQLIQGPPGQEALPAHERLHRLAADQWERRQRQTRGRSLDAVPGLGSGGQGAYVYNVGEAGGRGVSPPRPPSPPPRREGGEFAPKINARSRELAARRLRPEGRPVETVLLQAKEEYDRRRAARAELEERKAQALQDAKKTNERSAALVAAMPGRQQVRSVERLHRGLLPHGKRTSRPEEDPTFHPLISAGSRRILERKEQAPGGGGPAAADIAQRTRAWLDQRPRNDRRRTERARRREMEECSFAPLMEAAGGGGGSPRGAGAGTARQGSGGGSPPTAAAAGKARRGSGGTAGGLSSDGGASAAGGSEGQAGRTKAFLERYAKDHEGKDIGERAASFLKRRQDRLDAARKEKTEKELEGYTFKPDMLASKTSEKLAVKRTSVIPVTPKTQQWWYEDVTNGGKTDASRSSGQGSSNFRNLLSKPSDNLSAIGPRPTFPQSGTPPGPPSHTGIGQRISDEEKRSGLDHSAQSDFQERSQNSTTGRNCGIPEESALLDSAAAKLENFINVTSKVGGGDESGMRNGIENADDVGDEAGPPLGGGDARENLLKEVGRARLEIRQSKHLFEDQTPSGGEMNTKKKLGVEMTSSFEHLETTLQDFNRYNAPSPYLVDSSARPGQSFFNKKSATASTSQQFVGDEEHLPIRRNSHRQPPKRQSISSEPAADENGLPDISQGRSETSKTAHYNSGGATSNTIASSAHHGDAGPCSAEGVTPEGEEEDSSTKRKLPPGWLEFFSDEGIPYYYNALAGKTQWEIPVQEEGDGFHE